MASTVQLADYLLTRLQQLGVDSIHGVPGDYNLTLLDYVEDQGLHWVGNSNELNAGYAADAYSRIKGLGALITTFGVGELSAANAIAGAYAELAPVVHIVGTPARYQQDSRALIHHTFNDGDYGHFARMAEHITVAQTRLWDPRTSPEQIDTTIQQCLIHSRPVYIQIPVDMVSAQVPSERLKSKLELPEATLSKDQASALSLVLDRMNASQRPVILVDGESRAYGILDEVQELITKTQWPTWTSTFGKSCIDETLPNVYGIWKGDWGDKETNEYFKSSDLILCFGPHFSSTNSYQHATIPDPKVSILFGQTSIEASGKKFRDLPAKSFINALLKEFDSSKATKTTFSGTKVDPSSNTQLDPNGLITQDKFYHVLNRCFRDGDVILAETGTPAYGCRDFNLPARTHLFKPATWLSIGYTLPATQGAALAQRELYAAGKWDKAPSLKQPPRTILLVGDGSFQMTVQELGTIIREKLNVLIVLINNAGYTIERCLHGWDRQYNDIATWNYLQAPAFLGASDNKQAGYHARTFHADTWKEFEDALAFEDTVESPMLRMVEVKMGWEDAPAPLLAFLNNQKAAQPKTTVATNGTDAEKK